MNKILKLYVAATITSLFLLHIYIATAGDGEPSEFASLMLIAIGFVPGLFTYFKRKDIFKRAYMNYIMHVIFYLLVNLSFWIHASVQYLSATSAEVNGQLIISQDWTVHILYVPLFWGIGLLVHTATVWKSKGFDEIKL